MFIMKFGFLFTPGLGFRDVTRGLITKSWNSFWSLNPSASSIWMHPCGFYWWFYPIVLPNDIIYNLQGAPSGEAFIQMDSDAAAIACSSDRHNKYMHIGKKQRYIEVFQCSADDMNLVLTGPTPLPTTPVLPPNSLSLTGLQQLQQRGMISPGIIRWSEGLD